MIQTYPVGYFARVSCNGFVYELHPKYRRMFVRMTSAQQEWLFRAMAAYSEGWRDRPLQFLGDWP